MTFYDFINLEPEDGLSYHVLTLTVDGFALRLPVRARSLGRLRTPTGTGRWTPPVSFVSAALDPSSPLRRDEREGEISMQLQMLPAGESGKGTFEEAPAAGSRRKRDLLLNLGALLLAAAIFAALDGAAARSRAIPAAESVVRPASVHRLDRQQDAYRAYRSAGLRGAGIVHLNRYFNMKAYAPKDQFVTVEFPLSIRELHEAFEPGIDSHSWLYIATRTGMARTVTTVLPEEVFAELLRTSPPSSGFTYWAGSIRGYSFDIPRRITTLRALPAVREPVVVNLDAGYFSGNEDPAGTAALLKERCPDVRMLLLIDSVDKPEITDHMRERLRRFEAAWRMAQ